MRDWSRRAVVCLLSVLGTGVLANPGLAQQPLSIVDVPFISQSEALCGGAAAAMVLRYWGERELSAESFAHLVDRSAAGIRTDALVQDLRTRGWEATAVEGTEDLAVRELAQGRPVVALIEDRPGAFHYIVLVAWHERGVVFHDPARAPFRVQTIAEFTRRWRAAARWMLVLTPGSRDVQPGVPAAARLSDVGAAAVSPCDALVAEGVRAAQTQDLAGAERALVAGLSCPGGAAMRELAGVRLLQRRWPDVTMLAAAAVAEDPDDTYAWKLLATGRFVQDDVDGALDAWNHVGEPRVDLVRIDNLTRTRHRVVEGLIGIDTGSMLTPTAFGRARRRVSELPSVTAARLELVPAPGGLVEIRGAVSERPLFPSSPVELLGVGLVALASREVGLAIGSMTGGGERVSLGWRFRRHSPRVALGIHAPAPWGGVWGIESFAERQAFDSPLIDDAERLTATVVAADWATRTLRWEARAGVDHRKDQGSLPTIGGNVRLVSGRGHVDAVVRADTWLGSERFAMGEFLVNGRSSAARRGTVLLGSSILQLSSPSTPLDLWPAGDTGLARPGMLRAHPVLDDGRLRVDRLGRAYVGASVEARRWWSLRGWVQTGAGIFLDVGQTGLRLNGDPHRDLDVGAGARLAVLGLPGLFRIDVAKGLRDGKTVLSAVYEP